MIYRALQPEQNELREGLPVPLLFDGERASSPDKYTGASVDNPTRMRALVLYVITSLAWFEMVAESLIAQACVWIQARPSKRN